jgi:hypothetical protein
VLAEQRVVVVIYSTVPAEDEADPGEGPPPSRREGAPAAEAPADDHDEHLAGQQQQQRADAVRGGRVGAVHAVGPAAPVHVHVRLRSNIVTLRRLSGLVCVDCAAS